MSKRRIIDLCDSNAPLACDFSSQKTNNAEGSYM